MRIAYDVATGAISGYGHGTAAAAAPSSHTTRRTDEQTLRELLGHDDAPDGPDDGIGGRIVVRGDTTRLIFVPRHRFLGCLPQESDLNRYRVFLDRGISSNHVVDTEKLICECFESVLKLPDITTERLTDFCLEKYLCLLDC